MLSGFKVRGAPNLQTSYAYPNDGLWFDYNKNLYLNYGEKGKEVDMEYEVTTGDGIYLRFKGYCYIY